MDISATAVRFDVNSMWVDLSDGRTIGVSRTRVPDTPMHLIIQAETYTDGTIPPPRAAGNFQIDWLAVYRRT